MLGRKVFFFDPDQMHKISEAAKASSCHTADASPLAAESSQSFYLLLSLAVPLHYHVIAFSLIIWPQSLRMKLENQAPYRGGGQGSILDTRCRLCIVARVRLKQAAECSRDHSIILQQIFIGCLLGISSFWALGGQ